MKITPIDIRQQQFGRSLRGLDAREVDSFLNLVSDELETLQRENNRFKEELARTMRIVEEHRERERTLKETMITAQRITDDIKEGARKEAEIIISRAEIQAEKIIHAANDRLIKVIEDINEMKRQREQLRVGLSNLVESHRKLLREIHEEKSAQLFVSIEELRQRRARLHAEVQEVLEAHASLLGLERERETEDVREEVERLRSLQTNLMSRIQGAIETHSKLLEAREEAEGRDRSTHPVEDSLRVLRQPDKDGDAKQATGRRDEDMKKRAKEKVR